VGWRFLTCRVLPGFIVTAATRLNRGLAVPSQHSLPSPLALLPVAHSPSRPCLHGRWWALTPPVRPLPALPRALAGMLSVAVVVRTRLSPACPHLLFRGATLSRY
jgi:hypothetical protein